MIRWEYLVTMVSSKVFDVFDVVGPLLNRYGVEGWELVSATHMAYDMVRFIFKRPLDKRPRKK